MSQWLAANGGLVASVVLVATVLNIVLSAAKAVVEVLEPTPEAQANNKILKFIGSAMGWVKNVLDWLSANKPH